MLILTASYSLFNWSRSEEEASASDLEMMTALCRDDRTDSEGQGSLSFDSAHERHKSPRHVDKDRERERNRGMYQIEFGILD